MKGMLLRAFGDERCLQLETHLEEPDAAMCGANQAVLKVLSCAVDALDVDVRLGCYGNVTALPLTPGYGVCGRVHRVGDDVAHLDVGELVFGMISLDNRWGGYAEFAVVNAFDVVKKPSSISADAACSLVLPGLRTLTAFHQLLHLKDNEFLFVLGNHFGSQEVLLQLSAVYSVRLIIAAYSAEQLNLYLDAGEHVVRVIDMSSVPSSKAVLEAVLEETGGLGVHCVLDLQDDEADSGKQHEPRLNENEILSCLSVQGRWATARRDLNLRRHELEMLHVLGAQLSFLNVQSWLFAPVRQGLFVHMLQELFRLVASGRLQAGMCTAFPLHKARRLHRLGLLPVGTAVLHVDDDDDEDDDDDDEDKQ